MTSPMRMDEYDGKRFLAAVRGEDFAHAGEAESIDLVFSRIAPRADWQVADVGCGRGGTANYVREHGWGDVVGVDIDASSIEYAQTKYPALKFSVCSMESIGAKYPEQFDLLYLFNVFYASPEKFAALSSFRQATKHGGTLCIFDYVYYKPDEELPAVFLGQRPATPDEIATGMQETSWKVSTNENLDEKYIEWYRRFVAKFDDPALTAHYAPDVIEGVRSKYAELLASLESGVLGGVLILAHAV